MDRLLKLLFGSALMMSASASWADEASEPTDLVRFIQPLNQVQLTLSAETWAKTSTARVIVTVDAVLSQSGIANMHKTIEQKLTRISNAAPWHITTFDRQKDKSDLERLTVTAEARLPEAALIDARKHVDELSKEGEKYRLTSIEFTPSLADMEVARQSVRDQILAQAKLELSKLNSLYPDQHYFLNLVTFNPENPAPPMQNRSEMRMAAAGVAAPVALTVSDKVEMTAQVTFAARLPARAIAKTTP